MSEDSQIVVPPSFVALFVPPGRIKPAAGREHIAARYELCEDLAQMLTEQATMKKWDLGVTEHDVLERFERGLCADDAVVNAAEARWVVRRLAELLGWPDPGPAVDAGGIDAT
jgi:phage I-like protein